MTPRSELVEREDSRSGTRDARTQMLLTAPLLPMLLRLAAPNLVLILVQQAVGLIEVFWIGHLGTDALAGVTLVFPLLAIMQAMATGAIGGGISSAIARALGRNRRDEGNDLAAHALIVSAALGTFFMVALLVCGPSLYRLLGGRGASLSAALVYSNMVFAGMVPLWVFSALASILRGTGNMRLPALVSSLGAIVLVPLSPLLIFGWGPVPSFGVAGGGAAVILYYVGGSLILARRVLGGREIVRPRWRGLVLRRAWFYEILRVGMVAAMITLTTNVTVAFTTALVGHAGTDTIAGYGIGARLEALLVPLSFGIGAPLVAIVGTCIGAGDLRRAMRAAWLGAGVSALLAETIGLLVACWPDAWLGLFSTSPTVLSAGHDYLRIVGPAYGAFGLGMTLYFASQGAGRLFWPASAGMLRLTIATLGAYVGAEMLGYGPVGAYVALAAALLVFGTTIAASVAFGAWSPRSAR
jgi:putative MATE family efflux protein